VKRVVIEAEINDSAAPAVEAPRVEAAPVEPARARQRERGPRRERRDDRSDRRRRGERRDRDDRPPRREESVEFAPTEPVPDQGEESPAAASVRAWCEEVLRLAKLDVVVRTTENDTQINVGVYGRDARRLLDHHGEVLDALQVLANKALVGRSVEKDVELDCASFKERRADELRTRALETANRVRSEGREELLPAMSPIERRIVHLALQDDPEVTTESRGEGFYKRVAIILRPAQPAPTEP
jgi:spoIIIJ-associated protein